MKYYKRILGTSLAVGLALAGLAHAQEAAQPQKSVASTGAPAFDEGERRFREGLERLFRLEPRQKRQVLERTIEDQRAGRLEPPKGLQTRSKTFSLKPGAPIETVYLRPDYPSTIVVLDATGQPWPIKSAVPGNGDWVSIQAPPEGPGNVLTLIPNTFEANTGLVMHLEPSIPVNLQLVISSSDTPDQQLTLRADRPGPKASEPEVHVDYAPESVDRLMIDILYGTPPSDAQRLVTDNPVVESWELAGLMYVRTPHQVVWPNFQASSTNGEGETRMYAYRLPRVPQIQLAPESGRPIFVTIED